MSGGALRSAKAMDRAASIGYDGEVLRALILALTLLLAFPGTAGASTCHDGTMPGMTMAGTETVAKGAALPKHRHPAVAGHLCVGCVAPDRRVAHLAAPLWSPPLVPIARPTRLTSGRDGPPLTPPPRV